MNKDTQLLAEAYDKKVKVHDLVSQLKQNWTNYIQERIKTNPQDYPHPQFKQTLSQIQVASDLDALNNIWNNTVWNELFTSFKDFSELYLGIDLPSIPQKRIKGQKKFIHYTFERGHLQEQEHITALNIVDALNSVSHNYPISKTDIKSDNFVIFNDEGYLDIIAQKGPELKKFLKLAENDQLDDLDPNWSTFSDKYTIFRE